MIKGSCRDKPSVEVHQSQKTLQLLAVNQLWELSDDLHMLYYWLHPGGGDVMAQEVNGNTTQLALLQIQYQPILAQVLNNQA